MVGQNKPVSVRQARISDAAACSAVLCSSIRELCIPDHQGDEKIIAGWIDNKTPEALGSWIQSSEASIYVAEINGQIVGVGGLSGSEISLNYVSPDYRGLGVSTAVLEKLEEVLLDDGIHDAQLTSTSTARDFYRKAGWVDSGEPEESLGVTGFPMKKFL